jgi:hypothetical protein
MPLANPFVRRVKRRMLGGPPQAVDIAHDFRQRVKEAADYRTMYGVIGQELWQAEKLYYSSTNAFQKENGVLLAIDAGRATLDEVVNPWLAARICEGYLWPMTDFADSKEARRVNLDTMFDLCNRTFREAGETNNIIANYKRLVAKADKPDRADKARIHLSVCSRRSANMPTPSNT